MPRTTIDGLAVKLDLIHDYNKLAFDKIDKHLEKLNGKSDRHDKFISRFKGAGITITILGILAGIICGIINLF